MNRRTTSSRSRLALALGSAVLLISLSAGSVLAGEITGNGDPVPTQGASWCRFSGLNDKVEGEGPVEPQAQSYGIEVTVGAVPHPRLSKGGAPSPGTMCNPQKTFLPPLK
jgi:hypothetical protein